MLDALKVANNMAKVVSIGKPERSKGHWVIEICDPEKDYIHFTTEGLAEKAYSSLKSLWNKSNSDSGL